MAEKVILITGASGGLGADISSYLYENTDFKLALHYNKNKIAIAENERVLHVNADLLEDKQINSMMDKVLSVYGTIDVLINNAGVSKSNMCWKTQLSDWNETLAINLTAPFLLMKAVIPTMKNNNWGRIVSITSVVAQTGVIGTAAYAASKAGLIGLTKSVSKEVAQSGITVNALALGYFNRGMINDVPEDLKKEIVNSIPVKKLGDAHLICKQLLFLIDDDAAYITGQTINVNGGLFS